MTALRHIPLPLRIVALLIAAALFFRYGRDLGGLMAVVAAVLWTLTLTALLYDHGSLNALSRVPVVSHVLRFLTARAAAPGPHGGQPVARDLTDAERLALQAEGQAEIDALIGHEDTVGEIRSDLIEAARASANMPGRWFGTRFPGLVLVLFGPKGVGKTHAGRALAKIYAGVGWLRTAKLVVVSERDFNRAQQSMTLDDLATAKTQEAVGGTLLLDDADWLLGQDPRGGMRPGVEFGMAVLEVLSEHSQETLIILTMTESGERRLKNDPDHVRWLGKLAVRSLAFTGLDEDSLYEILSRALERDEIAIDGDAERPVRGLLRDELKRFGADNADNASAALRCASLLADAARRRNPGRGGAMTITRDDVRLAADGQ